MSTTAILCIARNEIPYTEEWLEYHFSIGIDRVYYISTDSDFARVKTVIDEYDFRSRITLLHFDDFKPGWQMRCYNEYLPLIEEDWVLVIDIDEFLYLNTFSNIQEYLQGVDREIGQIQFPWLILMSNNYFEYRVFDILSRSDKYVSDHVKSMFRRDCCSWVGIHAHNIEKLKNRFSSGDEVEKRNRHSALLSNPGYFDKHPYVLHFSSRGYLDVMNRILDHQFFNSNNGKAEEDRLSSYLTGTASWSNIPTRFMLEKFWSTLPTVQVQCQLPKISSTTNLYELERIFLKNIRKIVKFESSPDALLTKNFEDSYGLSQKLSTQSLSGLSELDDYMKCGTQIDHIVKLRNSLKNASSILTKNP